MRDGKGIEIKDNFIYDGFWKDNLKNGFGE